MKNNTSDLGMKKWQLNNISFFFQLLVFSFINLFPAFSKAEPVNFTQQSKINSVSVSCDSVFKTADVMPVFPEGEDSLIHYLAKNFRYPKLYLENKLIGQVICRFVVSDQGRILNAEVINTPDSLVGEEVIRVVRTMPDWIPGKVKGKNVCVEYLLPVNFKEQPDVPEQETGLLTRLIEQEEKDIEFRDLYPIETPPGFKGGEGKLIEFIYSNLQYPEKAFKEKIEGRVICSFIVGTNGVVDSPTIVRSSNPVFDAEVLRLVRSMPPWSPGTLQGKVVRIRYTIPVRFKLPVVIDTLTYTYKNELTHKTQIVESYELSNKSGENYLTWVALENTSGVSDEKLIRDYFFKRKGDFTLFQLMTENLIDPVDLFYVGFTFLKKIAPGNSFTYQIIKDYPDSNLYKDRIVVVKESDVERYLSIKIEDRYLYQSADLVLTGNSE